MSEYQLTEKIIALSVSDRWDEAKLEWSLWKIYITTEPERCLCGHFPIIELCNLKNIKNGKSATVGNCCVKKFLGLPSDKIFQAIKRIRKDIKKSLNAEAIDYAFKKKWITPWEKNFYFDVMRKRNLSDKQLKVKKRINKKVLIKLWEKQMSETGTSSS